jgi:pentapeptide repeat protein
MANPEHFEILKGGSSAWNRWRAENPSILPDLEGAHLREGRLSGANLARADLRLAYFGPGRPFWSRFERRRSF